MSHKRFWITVTCFAVANILAWVAFHHAYQLRTLHLLKVEHFSPGNNATVGTKPVLSWEFNLEMKPEDVSSKVIIQNPAGQAYLIPGNWEWVNTRKLSFTPQRDLPKATAFTFTFPLHSLKSKEGFLLNQAYSVSVQTSPLQVLSVRQAAFDEKDQFMIEMEFSDDVLPTEVSKYLEIESLDHQKIPFRLYEGVKRNRIRVMTELSPLLRQNGSTSPQIILRIRKDLGGISGPLGLSAPYETQLSLNQHLMITQVEPYASSKGKIRLNLYLNNEIDLEVLKEILSLEPALPFTLIREWFGVSLEADFIPGQRYALKINKPTVKNSSKNYPQEDLFSVFIPDRRPSVWFEQDHGYLGAKGNRTILAHAINLQNIRVSVTQMYESNVVNWRNTVYDNQWYGLHHFSQVIRQKSLKLNVEKNKIQDISLCLDDLLPKDSGQDGVYEVQIKSEDEDQSWISDSTVVTLSDIGLVAKRAPQGLFVWTVSLKTGQPVGQVRIRAFSSKNQLLGEGISNENGIVKIDTIEPPSDEKLAVIVADRSIDASHGHLTWLDLRTSELSYSLFDVAGSPYSPKGYDAFVYTERGAYRPGETVHLWGIVRGPRLSVPEKFPIEWQFYRPDSRKWKSKIAQIDSNGMTHLAMKLPRDIPTGNWTVSVGLPKTKDTDSKSFGTVSFLVEEFLPDRMKVALSFKNIRHRRYALLSSKPLSVEMEGNYLFGQPASGIDATFSGRLDPVSFKHKYWKGWTFGDHADTLKTLGVPLPQSQNNIEGPKMKMDEKGKGEWEVDLSSIHRTPHPREDKIKHSISSSLPQNLTHAGPWQLTVMGSVQEMGGRAVSASQSIIIDTLAYYIGIHPHKNQVAEPGVTYTLDIAAISGQGKRVKISKELNLQLFRETWNNIMTYRDGSYHYDSTRLLDTISSSLFVLKNGQGHFDVIAPSEGCYVMTVHDPQTGDFTSYRFYVSSEKGWEDNISRENPEQLEVKIIPFHSSLQEKWNIFFYMPFQVLSENSGHRSTSFKVGEKAQVIIRSPFPGQLLLTIETDHVIFHKVIPMSESHLAIPIDILESYRPNAYVSATVIQSIDSHAPWKTHRAFGVTRLLINNEDQKLNVKIHVADEILPKSKVHVETQILNPKGVPVKNASVTLALVDEGILLLTNFSTPNPFLFFHRNRALNVFTSDLYGELFPEIQKVDAKSAVGGDGSYDPRHLSPISVKHIHHVALVSKVLHSDTNGKVQAHFRLPEFTGGLRIMAMAHSQNLFGSAAKTILVKSPLMLQSTAPRFVATGDQFEIPIVIFNHTGSEGTASLSVELEDKSPIHFSEGSERKISLSSNLIQAGSQDMITVPITAEKEMGIAHLKIKAELNGQKYQQRLTFPVRAPYPITSDGGYATLLPGQEFKIKVPSKWTQGTTKVNICVTPFPTLNLTHALDYLNEYPHGCVEQTVSTAFPLIGLEKMGAKMAPHQFNPEYIRQRFDTALNRLMSMQTSNGGLAMWPGYPEDWSWASVYATHFIVEAENAGFPIPSDFRDRLLSYVRRLLIQSSDQPDTLETQAYACFVLAKTGQPERSMMTRLEDIILKSSENISVPSQEIHSSTRFYLALAWLYSGRKDLALKLIPQTFPSPRKTRDLSGNIGSGIRDRAILTQSLLEIDPQNPALPKLIQELAQAGDEHQWQSTQDNAFALLALGHYLEKTDFGEPFASAELWSGTEKISQSINGKSLLWNSNELLSIEPLLPLLATGAWKKVGMRGNLSHPHKEFHVKILGHEKTKGYVSWNITGIAKDPPLNEDHGILIRKRYLNRQGNLISLDKIHSGDLIQVELSLESPMAYDNMVIEDLLPAGFEIENPRLETSAQLLKDTVQTTFMDSHIDIRDDRLILYGKMSGKGKAHYTYLVRAVTPGTFVIPPVRAECMYDISINSISRDNETMKIAQL